VIGMIVDKLHFVVLPELFLVLQVML
jgi:hypothetical protein